MCTTSVRSSPLRCRSGRMGGISKAIQRVEWATVPPHCPKAPRYRTSCLPLLFNLIRRGHRYKGDFVCYEVTASTINPKDRSKFLKPNSSLGQIVTSHTFFMLMPAAAGTLHVFRLSHSHLLFFPTLSCFLQCYYVDVDPWYLSYNRNPNN